MKNKILLSTLLGGALLAACTADDALDVKEVAGGVNPAAPVFNISFNGGEEDGLTRADMDASTGMRWQSTDKMSLFHGGGKMNSNTGTPTKLDGSDDFLETGWVRNFNAIYSNVSDGATYRFETEAMVNEGLAIMVFPADTNYAQAYSNPHISISMSQVGGKVGERTRDKAPFVSEMLNIAKYTGDDNKHEAGYGREYDLVMRRIGGLLKLNLETTGDDAILAAGAKGVEYRQVVMDVNAGRDLASNPFTSEMEIKVGQWRNGKHVKVVNTVHTVYTQNNTEDVTVGTNGDDQKYWEYTPWIIATKQSNTISTEDIVNKTAFFTLLPPAEDGKVLGETKTISRKDNAVDKEITLGTPVFAKPVVTVKTNYGKVTLNNETAKLWTKKESPSVYEMTLGEGIAEALTTFFPINNTKGGRYEGQVSGVGGDRYLAVNLKDLNMHGLHVKDQENLLDIFKVYDKVIKSNPEITLILDGDDNNRFVLDAKGWAEVEEHVTGSAKIHFALCAKQGEECKAILLDNKNNKAAEVPQLAFVKTITGAEADDKVQSYVEVELKGDWEYTKSGKELTNVDKLEVLEGSNLELKNKVTVKNQLYSSTSDRTKGLVIENDGTVNVNTDVDLGAHMINRGILNIAENAALSMNNVRMFINESGAPTDKDGNVNNEYGGVVNNAGWFAIEDKSDAMILNFGTIYQKNNAARLYITANATGTTSEGEKFGVNYDGKAASISDGGWNNGNKIGSIVLHDKNAGGDNVQIARANKQGFIKLLVEDVEDAESDSFGTVANYIILGKGVETYTDASNVHYVEVKKAAVEVVFNNIDETTGTTLKGLILNPEAKINIPKKVSVKVTIATYLKYLVSLGGTFTPKQYTGYFGGADSDYTNVKTY